MVKLYLSQVAPHRASRVHVTFALTLNLSLMLGERL